MSAQRSLMNVISMKPGQHQDDPDPGRHPGPLHAQVRGHPPDRGGDSPFSKAMSSAMDRDMAGVKVAGVVNDNRPPPHGLRTRHPGRQRRRFTWPIPTSTWLRKMSNMIRPCAATRPPRPPSARSRTCSARPWKSASNGESSWLFPPVALSAYRAANEPDRGC